MKTESRRRAPQKVKSFLVLFFKKERLPSFPPAQVATISLRLKTF